ncbi:hypothetical protein [Niabella hibiscisoli]|uniref:hypothetical protein n=1 Tax=Niabella hibiscisoli TaxID=1825928 RepID=UPI001F10C1D2|nr:hypothetical protein [Niabella hibiscisoli]MCH5719199.1 hypothetical protein [Niabella hibiscisoli]
MKSNAVNGNADTVLSYDLDIDIKGSRWLISAAGLLLLLLSFSKYKKVLSVFTLLTLSCLLYGCSKSSLPAEDLNTTIYVRIAQIDKDGAMSFSKAVKVVTAE